VYVIGDCLPGVMGLSCRSRGRRGVITERVHIRESRIGGWDAHIRG